MTSKQESDISHFSPMETVASLLKLVTDKEEDILRRRYGLNERKEETLEQIGRAYNVTRERIRQIENSALQKIKKSKEFLNLIQKVDSIITNILHQHGGIMESDFFFSKLLTFTSHSDSNENAVNFIMSRLLNNKFKKQAGDNLRESWELKSHRNDLLIKSVELFFNILNEKSKPISQEEIINNFKKTDFFKNEEDFFTDDVINSYLRISEKISINPFGDFGLSSWGSINPKRINDKIFLVIKKHGEPLHFTKIAEMINKAGFDKKKAYPPTVHNELILNNEYVLVGRGIYALKEWGYKSGVVADVIIEVIKNSENSPSRQKIIDEVLKKRMVKKNTILLALTDKDKFKKNQDGGYYLVDNSQ